MALDILVFGPHPDDAEIGAGGLLLKMKSLGRSTGIIDMTTGDMGWGSPEERLAECAQAAKILKLDVRENLDLGDGQVEDSFENRCTVAAAIRRHRPDIVMAPYYNLPIGRGLGHNTTTTRPASWSRTPTTSRTCARRRSRASRSRPGECSSTSSRPAPRPRSSSTSRTRSTTG
jgi:hypothetical protein